MALLRDDADFADAIELAAERLDLDAAFVEKDYWVTQVLRVLAARYGASIVFKGGTSLSKGYGIIERFSEDVDVLVRPMHGSTIKSGEARLVEITDYVADELAVPWEAKRPGSRGRRASRADLLRYPQQIKPTVDVPREAGGVLLEAGYGDGREPAETVILTPLLCKPLEIDPIAHQDTEPFEIAALQPVRTLLEKVVLLHHVASRVQSGEDGARDERIGRHYHDIDKLLRHPETAKRLKDGREECLKLLVEIDAISASQYGGVTARPDGGYAAGPAFAPPADSALREWLRGRYDASADLLPHRTPAKWPNFETVLKRITEHADLL